MDHRTLLVVCLSLFVTGGIAQDGDKKDVQKPAEKAGDVTVPSYRNKDCPLMGKAAKSSFSIKTENGTIWFCCKACVGKAEKDPAGTYAKAYPKAEKLEAKVCPISQHEVKADGPKATYQGYEIPVCCKDCIVPVVANGDIVVTLLKNPKAKDVGNKTCPVTGKPVGDNAFVMIGDDLVRLSSKECVEDVKKDPAKALSKAKESAPKEEKKGS